MAHTPKPQRRRIKRSARRALRSGWDREYAMVQATSANAHREYARIQARLDAGALVVLRAVREPYWWAPFPPITRTVMGMAPMGRT